VTAAGSAAPEPSAAASAAAAGETARRRAAALTMHAVLSLKKCETAGAWMRFCRNPFRSKALLRIMIRPPESSPMLQHGIGPRRE
jgi:hypothetical protein